MHDTSTIEQVTGVTLSIHCGECRGQSLQRHLSELEVIWGVYHLTKLLEGWGDLIGFGCGVWFLESIPKGERGKATWQLVRGINILFSINAGRSGSARAVASAVAVAFSVQEELQRGVVR